jgi:hypothetical protein
LNVRVVRKLAGATADGASACGVAEDSGCHCCW